jgi:hypothetical protein
MQNWVVFGLSFREQLFLSQWRLLLAGLAYTNPTLAAASSKMSAC